MTDRNQVSGRRICNSTTADDRPHRMQCECNGAPADRKHGSRDASSNSLLLAMQCVACCPVMFTRDIARARRSRQIFDKVSWRNEHRNGTCVVGVLQTVPRNVLQAYPGLVARDGRSSVDVVLLPNAENVERPRPAYISRVATGTFSNALFAVMRTRVEAARCVVTRQELTNLQIVE